MTGSWIWLAGAIAAGTLLLAWLCLMILLRWESIQSGFIPVAMCHAVTPEIVNLAVEAGQLHPSEDVKMSHLQGGSFFRVPTSLLRSNHTVDDQST